MSDVELADLEEWLGHKGTQWFIERVAREWGADATMQRIEALQNNAMMDDALRKDQVNQVIVSRRAVNVVMGMVGAEIQRRRAAAAQRPDEFAGERRRGETL